MSFEELIKTLSERVNNLKDNILTEEATKTSIIMPFFQTLGYDVFNPMEFVPEFTADVGIKKGEKVDYAIFLNNELTLLIEAKSINERLEKHDSQLFRYFGTTCAKFAILTNGIIYRFYTDLDETNKMDSSPFLEINILDISDNDIAELRKFCKENFDLSKILDTASELKYLGLIKKVLKEEFTNPSDELVRLILNNNVYDGLKTQNIIDKYKPLVRKSISHYINDLVNDKIKNALNNTNESNSTPTDNVTLDDEIQEEPISNIVTTEDELQCYYIIKSILGKSIAYDRITYKDTASYFGVNIDGKVTKWICRISLKENIKFIIIPVESENVRYEFTNINDIYSFSEQLSNRLDVLIN